MKLIDLEKINLDNSLIEIITDMINQPTIDAIPVEWILDWLLKYEAAYKTREDVTRMLNDWRKENETSRLG